MIIGLSGASGSGKTTLTNALAGELRRRGYNVGVVKEVVRNVFPRYREKYGFKSLPELRKSPVVTQFQLEVFREQVRQEDEADRRYELVITDRTIYDNLFFTLFYHDSNYELLEQYIEELKVLESKRYQLIFLCSPLHENVDDGFRTTDLYYRNLQQFVIRRLIPPEIPVHVVPSFSEPKNRAIRKRVEYCMRVLRGGV